MHDHENEIQIQSRLAYLGNQIEQMQWELARLSRETQVSNASITAVRKYLLNSDAQVQIHKVSADLLTQLESQQEKLEDLAKTVKKLSRTQFKANTLSESKDQQFAQTVAFLQEIATKREELTVAQQQQEHKRLTQLQGQARSEVAADFLPVLDGIELALEHRIELPDLHQELTELRNEPDLLEEATSSPGFLSKIFHYGHKHSEPESRPNSRPQAVEQVLHEVHSAMAGWLHGLEIVRDRFLSLLAREGIERIPDVGTIFDPHLHVAIDTEERGDMPDNTIVAVIRKGYRHQERILRYAEVIVSKSAVQETPAKAEHSLPEDTEEETLQNLEEEHENGFEEDTTDNDEPDRAWQDDDDDDDEQEDNDGRPKASDD